MTSLLPIYGPSQSLYEGLCLHDLARPAVLRPLARANQGWRKD